MLHQLINYLFLSTLKCCLLCPSRYHCWLQRHSSHQLPSSKHADPTNRLPASLPPPPHSCPPPPPPPPGEGRGKGKMIPQAVLSKFSATQMQEDTKCNGGNLQIIAVSMQIIAVSMSMSQYLNQCEETGINVWITLTIITNVIITTRS